MNKSLKMTEIENTLYDVIVVGGGMAGAFAATAAAREGASVLLIEKNGYLGGAATAGLVHPFMPYFERPGGAIANAGLFTELLRRLHEIGASPSPKSCFFNDQLLKVTLDRLVPNNDANLKSVGNGVYEYTVPGAGLQEMKLLADKNEAGQCAVTLEAGKYYFTTETIEISQVQVSLEPQLTVIWKNTDNREVSWNGIYRFGLDGRDGNNECIETFSQDVWNVIKNGTFYIKFRPTNSNFNEFNMRITTGHWQRTWRGSDITSGNNLIKNNGDGTYYIEINFSGDEILNLLDAQHLLFTGSHYTPIELYCYM